MPLYIAKFPFYYQTSHYCGKFLHKKFLHTTAVPIIPLQEDLIKYPHNKSGYKADLIRSYKQLINEMSKQLKNCVQVTMSQNDDTCT